MDRVEIEHPLVWKGGQWPRGLLAAVAALLLAASLPAQQSSWISTVASALWAQVPAEQRAFLAQHQPEAEQWLQDQNLLQVLVRQEIVFTDAFLTEVFRRNARDSALRNQQVQVRSDGVVVLSGKKKVFFGLIGAKFFFDLRLEGYQFSPDRRLFRFRILKSKPSDYNPNDDQTFRESPFLTYDDARRQITLDLDRLDESSAWFGRGWIPLISIKSIRFVDGRALVRFDVSRLDQTYGVSDAIRSLVASLVPDSN